MRVFLFWNITKSTHLLKMIFCLMKDLMVIQNLVFLKKKAGYNPLFVNL